MCHYLSFGNSKSVLFCCLVRCHKFIETPGAAVREAVAIVETWSRLRNGSISFTPC